MGRRNPRGFVGSNRCTTEVIHLRVACCGGYRGDGGDNGLYFGMLYAVSGGKEDGNDLRFI